MGQPAGRESLALYLLLNTISERFGKIQQAPSGSHSITFWCKLHFLDFVCYTAYSFAWGYWLSEPVVRDCFQIAIFVTLKSANVPYDVNAIFFKFLTPFKRLKNIRHFVSTTGHALAEVRRAVMFFFYFSNRKSDFHLNTRYRKIGFVTKYKNHSDLLKRFDYGHLCKNACVCMLHIFFHVGISTGVKYEWTEWTVQQFKMSIWTKCPSSQNLIQVKTYIET